ncbi:ribonucleoprotein PTB-binding 1-like [Scylla paramamosain]|uniref:ribonucleoprotein PTB-binding 1-like n=1 Tax=Scylla paramamosain TaxID=85552 RepID=UPI0030839882
MAASSTDAFSAPQQQLGASMQLYSNYSLVSVTTGGAFWPGEDSASPPRLGPQHLGSGRGGGRQEAHLRTQGDNSTTDVTFWCDTSPATPQSRPTLPSPLQEVRELLSGYLVHSVQLQPSSGSARVLLAEPEVLETWSRSQHTLRGHKVTISPSNTEGLLCVARLPQDFSEEDFANLAASLGQVTYCFLMRSEKTGESKGYGFIEYTNKELALQAKALLDGREVRDSLLVCDWLDPSHVTFASLHSTCLYVDHLPRNYRDMGEFRRIFSKVTNPPYCQIAMKNGALQDWGLVEFLEAEDAEETVYCLNNYKIRGHSIRVQYCVPGVRAINIYMKILNDPGGKKRSALLPEPPANKVFSQLQNLTKHNPAFATSLQNIILTQIQNLTGGDLTRGLHRLKDPLEDHAPHPQPGHPLLHLPQPQRPQLLPPLMQMQQQQQQQQQEAQQQQTNNLLASPYVLNLLQTLVQQGDPHQPPTQPPASLPPNQPPPQPPAADLRGSFTAKQHSQNGNAGNAAVAHPCLWRELWWWVVGGRRRRRRWWWWWRWWQWWWWWQRGGGWPGTTAVRPADQPAGALRTEDSEGRPAGDHLHPAVQCTQPATAAGHPHSQPAPAAPSLCPPCELRPPPHGCLHPSPSCGHLCPPTAPSQSPHVHAVDGRHRPPKPSLLGDGPLHPDAYLHPHLPPPTLEQPPHLAPPPLEQPPPPPISSAPAFLFASPVSSRVGPAWSPPPMPPPPPALLHPAPLPHPASLPHSRFISPVYLTPTKTMGPPLHPMGPAGGFITPVGQKRKSNHILPSPEPSPENGYVGQHSQGLGGHYADSYLVKKHRKH